MAKTKNTSLIELLKKIENDLMKDNLEPDVIIAKAKVLEVILKELRVNEL